MSGRACAKPRWRNSSQSCRSDSFQVSETESATYRKGSLSHLDPIPDVLQPDRRKRPVDAWVSEAPVAVRIRTVALPAERGRVGLRVGIEERCRRIEICEHRIVDALHGRAARLIHECVYVPEQHAVDLLLRTPPEQEPTVRRRPVIKRRVHPRFRPGMMRFFVVVRNAPVPAPQMIL